MELTRADADIYMNEPKWLLCDPAWVDKPNQEHRYKIAFHQSRVRLQQSMPRGLRFRISVFAPFPQSATFQLELDRSDMKRCLPIYRLELCALTGHCNSWDSTVAEEIRGLVFKQWETHEHSCLDHVTADGVMIRRGGVHAARPTPAQLQSYDDAFRHACGTLRIQNPEVVPPSGVQWPLLGA
jgi:hypothetical protein